jgi:hypothetical protein
MCSFLVLQGVFVSMATWVYYYLMSPLYYLLACIKSTRSFHCNSIDAYSVPGTNHSLYYSPLVPFSLSPISKGIILYLFIYFGGSTRIWTQGLTVARQVLYHWHRTSSPSTFSKCLVGFIMLSSPSGTFSIPLHSPDSPHQTASLLYSSPVIKTNVITLELGLSHSPWWSPVPSIFLQMT